MSQKYLSIFLGFILFLVYNGNLQGQNSQSRLKLRGVSDTLDEPNGNWTSQNVIIYNTSEADIMVRAGDIDNLGFGWPTAFDPFSGNSTPVHAFPFLPAANDVPGTDEIFVPSSDTGNPPYGNDGYYDTGVSPKSITLNYDLQGTTVLAATIQLFVDDFQGTMWGANWNVTFDGVNADFLTNIIMSLVQTGPIGKIITAQIPADYLQYLADGLLEVKIDDTTTGAGDGYAIDFVKLLINPKGFTYIGTIQGNITNSQNGTKITNALVTDSYKHDYSNSVGNYLVGGVPAGQVLINVSKSGYVAQSLIIDLVHGATVTQNFILVNDPNAVNITFTDGSSFTSNIIKGQKNQVSGRFQLIGASDGANLVGVTMQLNGIWRSGASNFKLWKSNDASFNGSNDTQLGITIQNDPGVGETLSFIGLSAPITNLQSYFFITCDMASNADGQIDCKFDSYDAITLDGGNFSGSMTDAILSDGTIYLSIEQKNTLSVDGNLVLFPAYPNPFNPSTTIRYGLDTDSYITLQIYDISGKVILTLINMNQVRGWHSINWNGTNQQGTQVPAGLYFSKITSGNEVKTTKLMLLK